MLSKERAEKLRWDLVNVLMGAVADHTPESEGGVHVNTIVYMKPTAIQLKKWAKEAGLTWEDISRDGIIEEVDE
jgi:hypothetical protein